MSDEKKREIYDKHGKAGLEDEGEEVELRCGPLIPPISLLQASYLTW